MLHMREATNYIKWLLYWTRDAYLFFFHFSLLSPPKLTFNIVPLMFLILGQLLRSNSILALI